MSTDAALDRTGRSRGRGRRRDSDGPYAGGHPTAAAGRCRRRRPCPPYLRRRRRRLLLGACPSSSCSCSWRCVCSRSTWSHAQTLAAYEAGDKPARWPGVSARAGSTSSSSSGRPFAIGDAHVLTGHFALARPWFEQAFEQVPKGGIDECKVRVNLGLTYEALGDAAKAEERTDGVETVLRQGDRHHRAASSALRRTRGRPDR